MKRKDRKEGNNMNMIFAFLCLIASIVTWILFGKAASDYGDFKQNLRHATSQDDRPKKTEEDLSFLKKRLFTAKKMMLIFLTVSMFMTFYWVIFWLPGIQPFFFNVFYRGAGLWLLWMIIAIIISLVTVLTKEKNGDYEIERAAIVFIVLFLVSGAVYGIFQGAWIKSKIYNSIQYSELSELPDTNGIRYLPMEVAWRSGENRLQEPRIKHIDADPIVVGNEVNWILTRAPKGIINEWSGNSDGFTIIDSKGEATTIRQRMTYGEGMLGTDSIFWQLHKRKYWSKITEMYYVGSQDGGVVAVAPYLNYRFSFPVRVPYWGGVLLVYSDGHIEDLSPKDAQNNPLLKGVRIFPEELARLYANAYAYKNGIDNTIFHHEDQIEIPTVGTGNQMPFLLPTEAGQKWFTAAVPWGAEGIYRIFLTDAITGNTEIFSLAKDSALIGPSRAKGYISRAYPYFNWDNLYILEPRPVMRQGALYWMFTVTPTNFAGITDTVFVDSKKSEVISFGSSSNALEMIFKFLAGQETGKLVGIGETSYASPAQAAVPTLIPGEISKEQLQQIIDQLNSLTKQLEGLKQTIQ